MADYRYLLASLLDGVVLAEVPFISAKWTDTLNSPGSFEGTLAIRQPDRVLTTLGPLLPGAIGQLAVYVERDGVILWGGIPWTAPPADLGTGTMTIRAEGFHSYLRRRTLQSDKDFVQVDQADIVVDLIDTAMASSFTPTIDTSDVQPTGVLRDRSWGAFERPWIGQLIEDMAAVQGGFDFRYVSGWDGDTITTRFVMQFPNTGRPTQIIFEEGKSITQMSLGTDATALCTHVDAMGAGEGDARLIGDVENPQLFGVYPLLDAVESATDVSVQATLNDKARQRLSRGSRPITLPSIHVDPAAEPTVGSYVVGDFAQVRGGYGLLQVSDLYRITQVTMTADNTGREEAEVTFASIGAFTAVA